MTKLFLLENGKRKLLLIMNGSNYGIKTGTFSILLKGEIFQLAQLGKRPGYKRGKNEIIRIDGK